MSFLAKLVPASGPLGGAEAAPKPEHLGSIRVAVVGEPSVGKTALTELIASGAAAKSSRSTAGCHIHVKLVQPGGAAPGPSGASSAAAASGQTFFVELWDVSGQAKYEALRSVFYKQLNGVILVYDLTNPATLSRLPKWAAEVAHEGSFVAPLADELAARNIGSLPVPVLVVGNKADRLRGASADAGSLAGLINAACSQVLGGRRCSAWWQRGLLRGLAGRRVGAASSGGGSEAGGGAPQSSDLEPHVRGLSTSAVAGQLDWGLLHAFLLALWERRYQPASQGLSAAFLARVPSFAGHPGLGAAVGAGAGGDSSSREQARLDDDWV